MQLILNGESIELVSETKQEDKFLRHVWINGVELLEFNSNKKYTSLVLRDKKTGVG